MSVPTGQPCEATVPAEDGLATPRCPLSSGRIGGGTGRFAIGAAGLLAGWMEDHRDPDICRGRRDVKPKPVPYGRITSAFLLSLTMVVALGVPTVAKEFE